MERSAGLYGATGSDCVCTDIGRLLPTKPASRLVRRGPLGSGCGCLWRLPRKVAPGRQDVARGQVRSFPRRHRRAVLALHCVLCTLHRCVLHIRLGDVVVDDALHPVPHCCSGTGCVGAGQSSQADRAPAKRRVGNPPTRECACCLPAVRQGLAPRNESSPSVTVRVPARTRPPDGVTAMPGRQPRGKVAAM